MAIWEPFNPFSLLCSLKGSLVKLLVSLLRIRLAPSDRETLSEEVNHKLAGHLMGGIEAVSGKTGHNYIGVRGVKIAVDTSIENVVGWLYTFPFKDKATSLQLILTLGMVDGDGQPLSEEMVLYFWLRQEARDNVRGHSYPG